MNIKKFNDESNKNMKKQPKVSIILPIYNASKYLHECLDSILKQTLKDIEIICVNDGSKDDSLDIIKEYTSIDQRIKYIDKPNAGYGHTMNRGIEVATGEYFGIVEPDDYIKPEMYETLYQKAKADSLDIVKSNLLCFRGDDERTFWTLKYMKDGQGYDIVDSPEKLQVHMMPSCFTTTAIYRTAFVKENKIRYNETPGAAYQDTLFWFATHCVAQKMCVMDKEFYVYRQDNPNQSVQNTRLVNALLYEYKTVYEFLKEHQKEKFIPLYFYRKVGGLYWYWTLQKGKDKKLYLKKIKESFAEDKANNCIKFDLFPPHEIKGFKNLMKYGTNIVNQVVYKLFCILPIYRVREFKNKKVYSLFGIPFGKIRYKHNGSKRKYYFLGIPLLKVTEK